MNLQNFQKDGKYLMLALDHRGSFKKYVNQDNPEAVSDDEVSEIKSLIIGSLNELMSGVLIDPVWGLPAYKNVGAEKPYLLCLEKTGYVESGKDRLTDLQYTGAELKKWGASGVKLLIYSNPNNAEAVKKQIATAKKALAEAHDNNLPLFLEFVTYGNEEAGKSRAEWVVKSLEIYLEAGIVPDVWKLEFPVSGGNEAEDLKYCKKITEIVGNTPWILLTRGEDFAVFKTQLEMAVQAGAVGFLAGRALWQEIGSFKDIKSKKEFLDGVVKDRFKEISQIVLSE